MDQRNDGGVTLTDAELARLALLLAELKHREAVPIIEIIQQAVRRRQGATTNIKAA